MRGRIEKVNGYACAAVAAFGGLVAQAESPAPSPVGQAGIVVGASGLAGLLILLIREGSPPLITLAHLLAANREERLKTRLALEQLTKVHAESLEEIRLLKLKNEEAEARADRSESLAREAKAVADALESRTVKVERRSRANTARSKKIEKAVEKVVSSGSGDAITPVADLPNGDGDAARAPDPEREGGRP
jgi:ABC-type multidrug transport system fused ATPase/permease subunit